MNKNIGKQIGSCFQLLLAAFIWGNAFVAQSAGMDYIGACTFSFLRFIIGGIVLIPCMMFLKKNKVKEENVCVSDKEDNKNVGVGKSKLKKTISGGMCCGVFLCIATLLQQFGIKYTTVGKAGFITALYIVLVPVFGIFLKRKVGIRVWIGVVLAAMGLYFLCINETFAIGKGDILVMMCAVVFTCQILTVDYFAPDVDVVMMSCVQFFTAGVLSAVPMLMFEEINIAAIVDGAIPILYTGVLSSGVAYTLQIIGQRDMNPAAASMIMSLESVFSVLAGAVILHQMLAPKELLGCVLMFAAIIISQINVDFS